MGLFGRGKTPDMPPLAEFPKTGEPVDFDKEEQFAIDRTIGEANRTHFKDRVFPDKKTAEQVSLFYAAGALEEVAKRRLQRGDLRGAASSCVKSLVLSNESGATYEGDWLLLAEIFAEHGDTVRAETLIKVAEKIHKNNAHILRPSQVFEQLWKQQIKKVEDIVKTKGRK